MLLDDVNLVAFEELDSLEDDAVVEETVEDAADFLKELNDDLITTEDDNSIVAEDDDSAVEKTFVIVDDPANDPEVKEADE